MSIDGGAEVRMVEAQSSRGLDETRWVDAGVGNGGLLLHRAALRVHRECRAPRRRYCARVQRYAGHRHRYLYHPRTTCQREAGLADRQDRSRARGYATSSGAAFGRVDGARFRGACRYGSGWEGDRWGGCYGRESAPFEVRGAKGLGARIRERIRTRQGRIRVERHSVCGLFADEQSPGGVRSGQLPSYDWEGNEAEVFQSLVRRAFPGGHLATGHRLAVRGS